MLAFYQRWARRLYPFRYGYMLLFLLAIAAFGWLIFAAPADVAQRWQLSTVLLALIGLLLWLWCTVFRYQLPQLHTVSGLGNRVRIRLQIVGYHALAVVVTVLLLATTYLGLRVVKGIIAILFFS